MTKLIDLNEEESESEEAKFNRALKNQPMVDGLQQYKNSSIVQIIKLMDSNHEESEEAIIFNRAIKPLVDGVQQKLYKNSTLLVDSYVTRLQLLVSGVGNAFCLSEPWNMLTPMHGAHVTYGMPCSSCFACGRLLL